MKHIIPTLTILLLLFGLITSLSTALSGISYYAVVLTFFSQIGLITYLSNKNLGLIAIMIVSMAWLYRYVERSIFLFLYDPYSSGRWSLVIPIILVSIPLFLFSYIYRQRLLQKPVDLRWLTTSFVFILSLALLSFIRKPHTNEYNCWYYIDPSRSNYKITFAITPEHTFEVYSSSKELKNFIENNGIRDPYREGIYCPETKLEIITRFKSITSISIVGFHNTTTNKYYRLPNSIYIDNDQVKGDRSILEPEFTL